MQAGFWNSSSGLSPLPWAIEPVLPTSGLPHSDNQTHRRLWLALGTLSGLFFIELGIGHWSHSLSLLADAGHVAVDTAAIGLTLWTTWLSHRSTDQEHPSKSRALETQAALVNAGSLVVVALWVAVEAVHRLQVGQTEILGMPMLLAALAGLLVNTLNALWLKGCSHHSLNLKSAFFHVLADAMSSVGVVMGAIAVYWLGWTWADGVISLLVSGLILVLAVPLLVQSSRYLCAPDVDNPDVSNRAIGQADPCDCRAHRLSVDLKVDRAIDTLLFPSLEDMIR